MYNNNSVYRLRLDHLSNTRTCYPAGLEGLVKDVKRDDGQRFTRSFLSGEFIFTGDDYTWLKAIEDGANNCVYIDAILDRSCDNQVTWTEYFVGRFTCSDAKWDLDRCRVSVELKPADAYTCLEAGSGESFNIISLPTEYTINDPGELKSYEWTIITGAVPCVNLQASPPVGAGWTWVGCDTTTSAPVNYGFFWREYKWTQCIAGSPQVPDGTGWSLDTNDCGTTGLAKYVRAPIEAAPNPATDFIFVNTCNGGVPDKPVGYSCVIELMDYLCATPWAWWWDRCPAAGTDYTHTRYLYDVVLGIAQTACSDITDIKSDFFEWNPPGDATGYVAGTNYVSGETPNKPNQLYLSHKSDILQPAATQPATVGNLTWNEITAYLYNMFQVCWWYDPIDSTIRFEHVSYNQYATGLDLTVGTYLRLNKGKKVYTYLRDKRYKFEKYNFMEANGVDFVGTDIIYNFNCIDPVIGGPKPGSNALHLANQNDNSKTYSVDKITTDIEYIISNPSEISSDGFVMLCAFDDGAANLTLDYEIGAISGNLKSNGHLAWANLHDKYWRHDRILIEGNMNGQDVTFESAKRTKRQADLIAYECCDTDINTEELVKTELGFGLIDNYKVSLMTGKMTINIDL